MMKKSADHGPQIFYIFIAFWYCCGIIVMCFLRETGENPVRARRRDMRNIFRSDPKPHSEKVSLGKPEKTDVNALSRNTEKSKTVFTKALRQPER